MQETTLRSLKSAFYDWLGAISIQEIMSNGRLIDGAKAVENILNDAKFQSKEKSEA